MCKYRIVKSYRRGVNQEVIPHYIIEQRIEIKNIFFPTTVIWRALTEYKFDCISYYGYYDNLEFKTLCEATKYFNNLIQELPDDEVVKTC